MSDTTSPHIATTAPLDLTAESATEVAAGAHGPLMLRLKADLAGAMRAGDALTLSTLRLAITALQNAEVAGSAARALTEAEELAVLTREAKTRRESAQIYADAGRPELADKEIAEAAVLARYLPAPLTPEELSALVDEAIARLTATTGTTPTMRDMGALVRTVNEGVAGRADGATVARLVKARLG